MNLSKEFLEEKQNGKEEWGVKGSALVENAPALNAATAFLIKGEFPATGKNALNAK